VDQPRIRRKQKKEKKVMNTMAGNKPRPKHPLQNSDVTHVEYTATPSGEMGVYKRITLADWLRIQGRSECHFCKTRTGDPHNYLCDFERCPRCGWRFFECLSGYSPCGRNGTWAAIEPTREQLVEDERIANTRQSATEKGLLDALQYLGDLVWSEAPEVQAIMRGLRGHDPQLQVAETLVRLARFEMPDVE
jgi:hypothetical protein